MLRKIMLYPKKFIRACPCDSKTDKCEYLQGPTQKILIFFQWLAYINYEWFLKELEMACDFAIKISIYIVCVCNIYIKFTKHRDLHECLDCSLYTQLHRFYFSCAGIMQNRQRNLCVKAIFFSRALHKHINGYFNRKSSTGKPRFKELSLFFRNSTMSCLKIHTVQDRFRDYLIIKCSVLKNLNLSCTEMFSF